MVKKHLTGAHYGIISWLQQRVTAVIMLIITLVFVGLILFIANNIDASITSWQTVFSHMWVKLIAQIFFAALVLHAWVGIRDIWMDYVKCDSLKLFLHVATILWLAMCIIYSVKVIW